jgi:hypothetical protein
MESTQTRNPRRHALLAIAAAAIAPDLAQAAGTDRRAEILQTIARYAAAWQAGSWLDLVQCYHADFTLHYGGSNPYAGEHHGRATALLTLARIGRRTGRRLLEVVDIMAGERRGALLVREAFERGSLKAELDRLFVYTVRDGRLHECWLYDADQALVDKFLSDSG